jgi:hypothetical protein
MPIENRNLEAGTRLMATYKKVQHICIVEQGEDGKDGKAEFVLEGGRRFKSPSSAGSAVMGGQPCNGWRFWTPESEVKQPRVKGPSKPTEKPDTKQNRLIRKAANQKSVPDGHARLFCAACGESHIMDVGQGMPSACPNGHAATTEEFLGEEGSAK